MDECWWVIPRLVLDAVASSSSVCGGWWVIISDFPKTKYKMQNTKKYKCSLALRHLHLYWSLFIIIRIGFIVCWLWSGDSGLVTKTAPLGPTTLLKNWKPNCFKSKFWFKLFYSIILILGGKPKLASIGQRYTPSKLSWKLKNIAKLAENAWVRGNSFKSIAWSCSVAWKLCLVFNLLMSFNIYWQHCSKEKHWPPAVSEKDQYKHQSFWRS